ncbi:hypothetical protein [Leminorella grimontii]|uniref:hypothetical protein n=1 Tax=Leminorella grimontii TaxID=82981 RepID=UPI00321FDE77
MLKSYAKIIYILGSVGLCYFSFIHTAQSVTFTYNPNATSICYYNLPELAPLSAPRTLVVDNTLPVGAELYHWGYNEFIPNINAYCQSSGKLPTPTGIISMYFFPVTGIAPDANGVYPTSISGIGIKFYFTYTSKGTSIYSSPYATTSLLGGTGNWLAANEPLNIEYSFTADMIGSRFYNDIQNSSNYYLSQQANNAAYSIRAVLVKTGSIGYSSTPLSMSRASTVQVGGLSGNLPVPNVIGGGGITVIPPACRLKASTDYTINMGRWVHSGPGSRQPGVSLPAYGPIVPVDINLECSGRVDNISFRFEDVGSSPLTNNNISLYDSGGTKIDGLEIVLFYGSNKINADNVSQVGLGSWGETNTNPKDTSFKPSIARFTAYYAQRAPIQRNGVSYTGPVTGKVNMYVTYY